MALIKTKNVRGALVMYDSELSYERWYDAFGPGVVKYLQEFVNLPADNTTIDPTEWAVTVVEVGGTSTAVLNDAAGGQLIITCAGNEDDGYSMQLGNANTGESVKFDGQYPTYFGIQFQLNDATDTDFVAGFAVTNTAILGGVTDGLYFRKVDASTTLNLVAEKDSVEVETAMATLVDATNVTAEFYFDGNTLYGYADGALMGSLARTSTSFPNDEELRLSIEFLSGEAVANTCAINWLRFIQIRA